MLIVPKFEPCDWTSGPGGEACASWSASVASTTAAATVSWLSRMDRMERFPLGHHEGARFRTSSADRLSAHRLRRRSHRGLGCDEESVRGRSQALPRTGEGLVDAVKASE